jgi:FecR protein
MGSVSSVARVFALTQTLLLLTCVNGSAQDSDQTTQSPAHLAYVDGAATLEREGQTETAVSGMPFVPGDRLLTMRGRIEVLFSDGTALAIDEYTTIELQDGALLRMMAGRVMLTVVGVNDPANAVRYQIDTPSASAATDGPGEYRVALMNGRGALETELAVFRGYATLATDVGSTAVRAGERTLARDDLAPSQPLLFNSARFDAFDRWASARRDARAGTTSTRYLPRDLYAYSSTFDSNGTWGYEAPYGNVWYPTVAPGWRPYSYGYWSSVPSYGWTWIGYDAWGWPTHHYGRWGFAGRWYWVPGSNWGSAWVSWASAPGYVGWCPVGYCGGGGFSLGVSFGNPWGWVVVSRPYFGYRYPVHHHALPPTAIPYRTPFVVQARAPLAPPAAVPRPRAIPRPPAGGPVLSQRAQSAPGRQPATVPGVASAVTPNQPELGGARARSGGRPSATVSAPAGARTRSTFASPPATNDNRYVPDTRTLGGRPPAAIPRRATPAPPASTDSATGASPRWYPPVTMTRPRTEQQPTVAPQPSPGYRTAPVPRAQPFMAPPSGAPGGARPRRPAGAPPVSAFQPPQVNSPPASPRGSVGVPPASAQMPRGPVAVPRAGPQPGAAPQAAPAQPASPSQPASPPAGARSPRSR